MPHLRKLLGCLLILSAVLVVRAASPKLASSASEFIREQAGSPVDWQLWDEAVLRSAKDSGKPVYVFVGSFLNELTRATCRQSFANADTAAFLNKNFVCIIVDREEQPDVAALAQHYLRTVKQLNNWPAHLWLTPDLKPFNGAGYLPPTEEWGKSSFLKTTQQVLAEWTSDVAGCRTRANEAVAQLAPAAPALPAAAAAPAKTKERLAATADTWRATFDAAHGGFGDPPKSPEPELLRFLLRQSPADHDAAVATLRAIAGSALRDPLDGGFFHYASDGSWRVPYLQKTLIDQARIALAYFDAAQGDDAKAFTAAGQGALDYALNRLLQSDGTFAAAEDGTADESVGYYVWTEAEVDTALGADAAAFKATHGVEAAGNVATDDDLSGKWKGKNFLRACLTSDAKDTAVAARLLATRSGRPALPRDDRASAGAHGLLLAALSHAGEPRYLAAAAKLYAVLQKQFLLSPDGELRHQRGSTVPASPADYAAVALGCREFARVAKRLEADAFAIRLLTKADAKFFDKTSGHYYAVAAELPLGIFARPPAIGEAPAAESLALLAGAPADEAALLTAGLWATVDETAAPAPGDALLALSAQP